jgi:hypothetical protein
MNPSKLIKLEWYLKFLQHWQNKEHTGNDDYARETDENAWIVQISRQYRQEASIINEDFLTWKLWL